MSDLTVHLPDREPYWIELAVGDASCRWRVKPLTTALMEAAKWASRRAMARAVKEGEEPTAPEVMGTGQAAFYAALARGAVIGWEGMADGETGGALACTPEIVEAVLAIPELAAAFDAAYVKPYAERNVEKNASTPARAGTTAAARATAGDAAPARADGARSAPT